MFSVFIYGQSEAKSRRRSIFFATQKIASSYYWLPYSTLVPHLFLTDEPFFHFHFYFLSFWLPYSFTHRTILTDSPGFFFLDFLTLWFFTHSILFEWSACLFFLSLFDCDYHILPAQVWLIPLDFFVDFLTFWFNTRACFLSDRPAGRPACLPPPPPLPPFFFFLLILFSSVVCNAQMKLQVWELNNSEKIRPKNDSSNT